MANAEGVYLMQNMQEVYGDGKKRIVFYKNGFDPEPRWVQNLQTVEATELTLLEIDSAEQVFSYFVDNPELSAVILMRLAETEDLKEIRDLMGELDTFRNKFCLVTILGADTDVLIEEAIWMNSRGFIDQEIMDLDYVSNLEERLRLYFEEVGVSIL